MDATVVLNPTRLILAAIIGLALLLLLIINSNFPHCFEVLNLEKSIL